MPSSRKFIYIIASGILCIAGAIYSAVNYDEFFPNGSTIKQSRDNGWTTPVNANSKEIMTPEGCKKITSTQGQMMFIPTKTPEEWNSFKNNLPSGVTIGSCAVNCSYTTYQGTACSATCGGGQYATYYTITTPASGGGSCPVTEGQLIAYNGAACNTQSCYTYSWQTSGWGSCSGETGTWNYSDWSACSVSCGGGNQTRSASCNRGNNGTQTRTVSCQRSDGTTVDDSYCTGTKPSTIQNNCTQETDDVCGTATLIQPCNTQICGCSPEVKQSPVTITHSPEGSCNLPAANNGSQHKCYFGCTLPQPYCGAADYTYTCVNSTWVIKNGECGTTNFTCNTGILTDKIQATKCGGLDSWKCGDVLCTAVHTCKWECGVCGGAGAGQACYYDMGYKTTVTCVVSNVTIGSECICK